LKKKELASKKNLELAWRRITTGHNQQYKKYFREIYYSYEVSLKENLRDLSDRLLNGSWNPQQPERIYLPKPSGLQRPITLLYIEDQIVLQAFANILAKKLFDKRKPLMLEHVFSNVLQSPNDIFFFKKWQITYFQYQAKISTLYNSGLKWVADFDIASFYDTISHDLLLQTAYPRLHDTEDVLWIRTCLKKWSTTGRSTSLGHGLPQGPLASAFLAECFLIPIDITLSNTTGYVRYVDDIRLFAKTEDEVRNAVLRLEVQCRERGLIPQMGKFSIKKANSVTEAQGLLPSIGDTNDSRTLSYIKPKDSLKYLRKALSGKPLRITDKTRAKHIFFTAGPSNELLRLALLLLPRHPELIDAFVNYMTLYDYRKSIRNVCLQVISTTPYPYVKGELYAILAKYLSQPQAFSRSERKKLIEEAIKVLKTKDDTLSLKLGAAKVLVAAESIYINKYTRFLNYQDSALLQAIIAGSLPKSSFDRKGTVPFFLKRSFFEPAIALAEKFILFKKSPCDLGINENELSSQAKNTYSRLGIISSAGHRADPIREILRKRYSIRSSTSWRTILGAEYPHAAGLLSQADVVFDSGPSRWLECQNSFNHALFLELQNYFVNNSIPGTVKTIDKHGKLIAFGVTLVASNAFSRQYPDIASSFREANDRRNKLPNIHPYDTKTLSRNVYLKAQERNRLVAKLKIAYTQIAGLFP
jgi:retron-type reverse transcriptase